MHVKALVASRGIELTCHPFRLGAHVVARGWRERLDENLGAISVKLTPDDLKEIEDSTGTLAVEGARYPEALERMTGI